MHADPRPAGEPAAPVIITEQGATFVFRFVSRVSDADVLTGIALIPAGQTASWWVHPQDVPAVKRWIDTQHAKGLSYGDIAEALAASGILTRERR